MEEELEEVKKKKKIKTGRKKKHARLHKSFLHFSKAALNKIHGHGHGHGRASGSNSKPPATAATSFLSACMHPRTQSFSSGGRQRRHRDDEALAVDFRSLRIGPAVVADVDDEGRDSSTQEDYGDCESEGGGVVAPVIAGKAVVASGASVAVVTVSIAPYEDFRRSMLEMADAAHAGRAAAAAPAVDWDFMEELLFCYLQLNDRAVHRDILQAFTDTVAALRRRRRAPAGSKPPKSRRTRRQLRRARGDVVDGDAEGVVVHNGRSSPAGRPAVDQTH